MNVEAKINDATSQMAASRAEMVRWLAIHPDALAPTHPAVTSTAPNKQSIQAQIVSLALASMTKSLFEKGPPISSAQLFQQTAEQLLSPIAKRHPWALVGAAALTGGVLVAAKPWRWLVRREVIDAFATQVVTRLLANITANPASSVPCPAEKTTTR